MQEGTVRQDTRIAVERLRYRLRERRDAVRSPRQRAEPRGLRKALIPAAARAIPPWSPRAAGVVTPACEPRRAVQVRGENWCQRADVARRAGVVASSSSVTLPVTVWRPRSRDGASEVSARHLAVIGIDDRRHPARGIWPRLSSQLRDRRHRHHRCVRPAAQKADLGPCRASGPILARAGNVERARPTSGMLLGADNDAAYAVVTLPLQSGDLLLCYTDGLLDGRTTETPTMRKEVREGVLGRVRPAGRRHADPATRVAGSPDAPTTTPATPGFCRVLP